MIIVSDLNGDYADGVPAHLQLENFSQSSETDVLFYGYNSVENFKLQQEYAHFSRKVLLNLWTPCEYFNKGDSYGRLARKQVEYFDEIYTICPFTINWHRRTTGDSRYRYIFHPFDGSYAPTDFEKTADICYFGGVHGPKHEAFVQGMTKFNYRLISMQPHSLITHHNVPHHTKLDLVAQTKISLCYNMLPLTEQHAAALINQYHQWEDNKAFGLLPSFMAPQYKCRAAEAAFCKSLLLVKRSPWKLIEHYFEPDKEFIYFDTVEEMQDKVADILSNYEQYQEIIDRAYKKSLNYMSEPLVNIIRNKEEWKPYD
jgi:hypothetical protein